MVGGLVVDPGTSLQVAEATAVEKVLIVVAEQSLPAPVEVADGDLVVLQVLILDEELQKDAVEAVGHVAGEAGGVQADLRSVGRQIVAAGQTHFVGAAEFTDRVRGDLGIVRLGSRQVEQEDAGVEVGGPRTTLVQIPGSFDVDFGGLVVAELVQVADVEPAGVEAALEGGVVDQHEAGLVDLLVHDVGLDRVDLGLGEDGDEQDDGDGDQLEQFHGTPPRFYVD